eukprot:TRINITY_DN263_c0_g1_i1.p1 TRINITY_DN263_c0_g1~~TRINITY_DN263_c0_g1_i1.p1  ORF type:complete len:206 (-),score=62.23 TRINITY_DN263_c0_g1_i1:17-634(-)
MKRNIMPQECYYDSVNNKDIHIQCKGQKEKDGNDLNWAIPMFKNLSKVDNIEEMMIDICLLGSEVKVKEMIGFLDEISEIELIDDYPVSQINQLKMNIINKEEELSTVIDSIRARINLKQEDEEFKKIIRKRDDLILGYVELLKEFQNKVDMATLHKSKGIIDQYIEQIETYQNYIRKHTTGENNNDQPMKKEGKSSDTQRKLEN